MFEQLIKIFVVFFVVIEPISLVPLFGALTRGATPRFRRVMALKATLLSGIILLVFAFSGDWLLKALGISVDAFKIAGGLLLFMVSVDMVFARQSGLRWSAPADRPAIRTR